MSSVKEILIRAASLNYVELVSKLLNQEIDINSIKDAKSDTLLHIAVKSMSIGVVELLLERNVNTNALNYSYECPLDIAIKKGRIDIINMFLVKGFDVNLSWNGKESFLYCAVKLKRSDIIESLCSCGANVDYRCPFGVEEGFTPLMLASKLGDQTIVSLLKLKGANINVESANKTNALYHAVEENHINIVKLLLEWGANTTVINTSAIERGFTPLHVACKNGSKEMVELLLQNKVEINAQECNKKTPLHLAIEYQHLEVVQLLLNYGADAEARCNARQEIGLTPLHLACKYKNAKIVDGLLNKRVNINTTFVGGYTALHVAILNLNLESAQLLLERGAQIDDIIVETFSLTWRFTLLIIACQEDFPLVVKLLLSNFVNVNKIIQAWVPSKMFPVQVNNGVIYLARDPQNNEFYTLDQIKELITVAEKKKHAFIFNYLQKYLSAL